MIRRPRLLSRPWLRLGLAVSAAVVVGVGSLRPPSALSTAFARVALATAGGRLVLELWHGRPEAEARFEARVLSAILTSGPLAAPVRLIAAEPLAGR
jgi:hypothetical protein